MFESGAFRILTLRGEAYELAPKSEVLPEVDLTQLARHVAEKDQHAALRAFRDELRGG